MPKALLQAIEREEGRSEALMSLCAFENRISPLVRRVLSSSLSDRYKLGSTGQREYYSDQVNYAGLTLVGYPELEQIETRALAAVKNMLGAGVTDVRPLSGVHAMTCTVLSCTEPGDVIYSLAPDAGGHFATSHIIERAGRVPRFFPVKGAQQDIDFDAFASEIAAAKPKMIFLDCGTPLHLIDVAKIREVIGLETILVFDASHTLGLICGGQLPNPLDQGADILQGNTHKSFPGPHKAMFHIRNPALAEKIQSDLSKGLVSSGHLHHMMGLFVALLEMEKFGKEYAATAVQNAQSLGRAIRENGIELVQDEDGTFTTSHIFLIKFDSEANAHAAAWRLLDGGIAVNSRIAFGIPVIRIGTQEITRLGMTPDDCKRLGLWIAEAIKQGITPDALRSKIEPMMAAHQSTVFCFDQPYPASDISFSSSRN